MPFGSRTQVGPGDVLDAGPDPSMRRGNFEGDVICTANDWLKEQYQQFLYNGIRSELWRNAGPGAFQLQETILKRDKI